MTGRKRLKRISNSYYNLGLKNAEARNLSGAIIALEKSLEFNKNNIEARNLLGLIKFEIGEVAEALVAWVISINIQSDNNRAEHFLYTVQKKEEVLENYAQLIQKYNQALIYAKHDNEDLAILTLSRIMQTNPNYVRAGNLLALLYLNKEDYIKANKTVLKVLKTDKHNPIALRYLNYIREKKISLDTDRHQLRDALSHRKLEDDDVIIPNTYKNYIGLQTAINISLGLLIGCAAMLFLYFPTNKAAINNAHNKELIELGEDLNTANLAVTELRRENADLSEELSKLKEAENTGEESITYALTQYETLIGMLDAYYKNEFERMSDLYVSFDASAINDIDDANQVALSPIVDMINIKANADGYIILLEAGNRFYNSEDYETALSYYDKSLKIKADYLPALLKKAETLRVLSRTEESDNLLGEIIINYPDTSEAARAREIRGY